MGFQFGYNQLENIVESISIIIQSETLNYNLNISQLRNGDICNEEINNNLFNFIYNIVYSRKINEI